MVANALSSANLSLLPDEFRLKIEKDLNKVADAIPDFLYTKENEFKKNWNNANMLEFLLGYCLGSCEGSYTQAFQQVYGDIPSKCQVSEIHNLISRRRSQIEQGIFAYLKERDSSFRH